MKKRGLLILGAGFILVAIWATSAMAADVAESTHNLQDFFPWASKPGGFAGNWPEGLAHFGIGLAGALVTVYLFLGEFLPSMGGKAEYELMRHELSDLKKRKDRALTELERYAKGESALSAERREAEQHLSDDLEADIERLEHKITRERWRLLGLGIPMYLLLGGFFASALAVNPIQAMAIGFGWTAIADRFGLQKELQEKSKIGQDQLNRLESQALTAAKEVSTLRTENTNLRKAIETTVLGPEGP
jgi:hypothetical protein